jgi:hypothetical protein
MRIFLCQHLVNSRFVFYSIKLAEKCLNRVRKKQARDAYKERGLGATGKARWRRKKRAEGWFLQKNAEICTRTTKFNIMS